MNKVYKSILGVTAATVVAVATLSPVIVNAWGDSSNGRKSYTLEQINNQELGNNVVMNSISNNQVIGDEKNFVGAKVAGANVTSWNANTIDVKDGETYTIRLYVHNNNPKGRDVVAEGVKATFSIPTTLSNSQTIVGYLDASNATPNRMWDEVTLNASENVYLEYVPGSAKFNNKSESGVERTFNLPDSVITSGATLGYDAMDGKIPGCYQYSGVVTIDVKVHSSVAAKVSKQVRIKGTKDWSESVEAKVGDEVEYQIEYVNLLSESVKNVMIRDVLPTNVEYVQNSTVLYNANHKDGIAMKENTLTTTGVNIGDYATKSNAFVRFTGKVVDKSMTCGKNQLVNWASATVSGSAIQNAVYKDDASVFVTKDDESCHDKPENPTPTPDNPGTPDTPVETPTTIVNTGAGTIVTGAIGAGSMVTTLGYYISSRKKLMK